MVDPDYTTTVESHVKGIRRMNLVLVVLIALGVAVQAPRLATGDPLDAYALGRLVGLLAAGSIFVAAFLLAYRAAAEDATTSLKQWAMWLNVLLLVLWLGLVAFFLATIGLAETLLPAIALLVWAFPAFLNVRAFRPRSTTK